MRLPRFITDGRFAVALAFTVFTVVGVYRDVVNEMRRRREHG